MANANRRSLSSFLAYKGMLEPCAAPFRNRARPTPFIQALALLPSNSGRRPLLAAPELSTVGEVTLFPCFLFLLHVCFSPRLPLSQAPSPVTGRAVPGASPLSSRSGRRARSLSPPVLRSRALHRSFTARWGCPSYTPGHLPPRIRLPAARPACAIRHSHRGALSVTQAPTQASWMCPPPLQQAVGSNRTRIHAS
jgi:hypothetical protein